MEVLHEPPTLTSFTPLSEHQSQTPASFYTGKPVLYHHCPNAKLLILERELRSSTALSKLAPGPLEPPVRAPNGTNAAAVGEEEGEEKEEREMTIEGLEIWVTSENFLLYSLSQKLGLSIPYPSISLHAIQTLQIPDSPIPTPTQGLFLQISTSDGFDDHDPDDTLSLTLIPSSSSSSTSTSSALATVEPSAEPEPSTATQTPIQELFTSLSACANLHPDPMSEDEDAEGLDPDTSMSYETATGISTNGLPPPIPGSGGWIMAENMGEFFDEEGNWRGGAVGGLGQGAGRIRTMDEVDGEEEGGEGEGGGGVWDVNGNGEGNGNGDGDGDGDGETKWRRTE
ncbi:MAG: hypothetical protein MMC33_009332 [Icmadophila ericetorum]|nr:hypothetical protein [Icmadophila ericetorum]